MGIFQLLPMATLSEFRLCSPSLPLAPKLDGLMSTIQIGPHLHVKLSRLKRGLWGPCSGSKKVMLISRGRRGQKSKRSRTRKSCSRWRVDHVRLGSGSTGLGSTGSVGLSVSRSCCQAFRSITIERCFFSQELSLRLPWLLSLL